MSKSEAKSKIWTVGGGKGGVGKSLISGSMAIDLAQKGEKVIVVDADLGGANLHTCLGLSSPEIGLSDFLTRRVEKMEDVIVPTPVANLGLISGAQDILNIANPKHAQKVRIIRELRELETDHLFIDLGAGTSFNTLDFYLMGDPQVIVVIPEPTSIENAYRFIKSAFYRQVRLNSPDNRIRKLVDETMNLNKRFGSKTPIEILDHLRSTDDEVADFVDNEVEIFRPKLVLNQVRSRSDIRIGFAMSNACSKYFGIHLDFVGHVDYDDTVWQSVVQRKPLMVHFPQSLVCQKVRSLTGNLISERILEQPQQQTS